jgi:hypothetical protein
MDKVLYPHRVYAKCYIDDIVVFSIDFESYIQHIRVILQLLKDLGMTLSPDKCYMTYHSIQLLGHQVDRFGLSILSDKISAIETIRFPSTLYELEIFVGLSGYYRHFVARYTALIESL